MYENGEGVEQSYEKAAQYYQSALDHDYPPAGYDLARLLEEGYIK